MTQPRAILLLVLTAIFWSLGGVLIKWIEWNPMAIAGMRSGIAALVLWAYVRRPHFTWSTAQIGGTVAYAATVTLFVLSNKLTTAANAILLQYTAPIYIALFGSRYLGEKTRGSDWSTIALVMGGMTLFFLDRLTTTNVLGNITAVASGVAFAWLALFLRKQKEGSPLESILLGNILTFLICLPFMFDGGPNMLGWVGLSILGVVQLGVSYILYSIAIRHVTALEAILVPVIEPILNPIWVLLVLGEQPGVWAIIGGAIVIATITFRNLAPFLGYGKPV